MKRIHLLLIVLVTGMVQDVHAHGARFYTSTVFCASEAIGCAATALYAHHKIKKLNNLNDHEKNNPEIKKKLEQLKARREAFSVFDDVCVHTTIHAGNRS